jgi:L-seryl-tRNA(Ser) seleniumtransferase
MVNDEPDPNDRPPSVDALARSLAPHSMLPDPMLIDVARQAIANQRWHDAQQLVEARQRTLLQRVINATGVLLHTNLGRAPYAAAPDGGPSNLEFDLETGRRGSRHDHAAALFAQLIDAEAALVVNNNAAAVVLVLSCLAKGSEVLVSRGESVEIGGGFRVPEVLGQSGATLVDVGTTNRTRLSDYADRRTERTAAILKIHPSNYRIEGFVEDVGIRQLASLGIPVVADIGSGLLDSACPWLTGGPPAWLHGEPAALQTLHDGAAVVTFSADKLLGGPQAGIIAGRQDLIELCRRHPLARALRPGSMILAALQQLALSYLRRDVATSVPFWRMATASTDELTVRARMIADAAHGSAHALEVASMESVPGAGSLPGVTIPSIGVRVDGDHARSLRMHTPPIIARVRDGVTLLDLRTVDPADDEYVIAGLRSITTS